ncbi:MAG: DUF1285 domain-containing protein [Pseudomonadota bacterium]
MTDGGTALNRLVTQIADGRSPGRAKAAPVDQWNPPFCGDIDMEIRADGTWYYLGTPIGRPALVNLFASVLRKDEDGKTYLVTPVEKMGIRVVDAPFLIVGLDQLDGSDGHALHVTTNVGEQITIGAANPLRFELQADTMGVKPYVHVRGRLEALMSRACTHELMNMGEHVEIDGVSQFAVQSQGHWYPIMETRALEEAMAQ